MQIRIPSLCSKGIGKYGFGPGMRVAYCPNIGGIAWYSCIVRACHVPCISYSKIHGSYNWIGILQSCSKPIKGGQMAISIPFAAKWPFLFLLWHGRPFLFLVTSVLLHSLPNRLQSWGGARFKMLSIFESPEWHS